MKRLSLILLVLSLIGLAGCQTSPLHRHRCLVATPELKVIKTPKGGIELEPYDAAALLIYIERLEECAGF